MLQPLIREDPSDWMRVTGASVRLSHVASSEREREMRKAESQHLNHSQRAPSSNGEKASEPDLEGIQETGSTEPVGPRKKPGFPAGWQEDHFTVLSRGVMNSLVLWKESLSATWEGRPQAEGGGLLRRPRQQAEQEATGALRDEQRRKSARPECRSSPEA